MRERENNQGRSMQLPPSWCGAICRNAMNEVCIEDCAIKRDCSAFEPKPSLKLEDMPRFPLKESANMTKEEKFTSVTVYLSKVVDHLKGIEDEPHHLTLPRASHVVSIDEKKTVTEVSSYLQDLLTDTVGVEADKAVNELTESNSNPLCGSESITSKENE